jgi:uncharacterized lipoprotein YddW (UPF0748 family)
MVDSEVRGVWLTLDDSDVLKSEANIRNALTKLKSYGFNTIYPAVWHSGYTLYPSTVAQNFIGAAVKPDEDFKTRNLIKELVKVSKEFGFRLIPWFEFGLMVAPDSPIDQLEQKDPSKFSDLITRTSCGDKIRMKKNDEGELVPDEFIWMNPCHPEVQNFMVQLIAEMVEQWEVDGIQLDDHFGWPKELGYDQLAENTYQKEKNGRMRETWASDKVTELVEKIFWAVDAKRKAKSSTCLISISPQPWQFSKENYRLDWQTWERKGFAEELVLQNYVPANFVTELDPRKHKEVEDARKHIPTIIGILTGLKSDKSPVPLNRITQHITEARNRKFAGVALFFYESIFNELSSSDEVSHISPRDETKVRHLFD